jgi:hypothetical protein
MTGQLPRRTFPCNECPVRRDNAGNPRSKFPAERWNALAETITGVEHAADFPGKPLFGCHKGEPGTNRDLTCAGWLAAFGWKSIPVRFAVALGTLDPAALTPGDGWLALYDDWDEMAVTQRWNPGDPDGHLPTDLCSARAEEKR